MVGWPDHEEAMKGAVLNVIVANNMLAESMPNKSNISESEELDLVSVLSFCIEMAGVTSGKGTPNGNSSNADWLGDVAVGASDRRGVVGADSVAEGESTADISSRGSVLEVSSSPDSEPTGSQLDRVVPEGIARADDGSESGAASSCSDVGNDRPEVCGFDGSVTVDRVLMLILGEEEVTDTDSKCAEATAGTLFASSCSLSHPLGRKFCPLGYASLTT